MADEYIKKHDAVDMCGGYGCLAHFMNNIKPADVAPVVHGRWVKEWWHGAAVRTCSVCHITQTVNVYEGEVKFKYCPYCGAKMDEGGEHG